jgi:hypothetical protein
MRRAIHSVFAGLFLTVAVAWLAVLCTILKPTGDLPQQSWPPGAPQGWPEPTRYCGFAGIGLRQVRLWESSSLHPQSGSAYMADTFIAGWPWGALQATRFERYPAVPNEPPARPTASLWHEGVLELPKRSGQGQRRLPIKPAFPGLALDLVTFGAATWMLLCFASIARRKLRSRKGLCPHCAYPLSGATCPECGKPPR